MASVESLITTFATLGISEFHEEPVTLVNKVEEVLRPYTLNQNTGNIYEIVVILNLYRQMGLTLEDLERLTPLFNAIKRTFKDFSEDLKLNKAIEMIKRLPIVSGTTTVIDGHTIVGLKNVTQSDNLGKTGDILLITDTGQELSVSICGGKVKRGGKVHKCLTNPTASRLKVPKKEIERFKQRGLTAVDEYKAFMTTKYGADESGWKSREKTIVAVNACKDVALWTAEIFERLDIEEKIGVFKDLLRIDSISDIPADYLICVHDEKLTLNMFKFNTPLFSSWNPTIIPDGIYLKLYNEDSEIGKIQIKFNNGVYHKGKTSSLTSSWNFTARLTDVFRLESL
jgi:hypothetical protein